MLVRHSLANVRMRWRWSFTHMVVTCFWRPSSCFPLSFFPIQAKMESQGFSFSGLIWMIDSRAISAASPQPAICPLVREEKKSVMDNGITPSPRHHLLWGKGMMEN